MSMRCPSWIPFELGAERGLFVCRWRTLDSSPHKDWHLSATADYKYTLEWDYSAPDFLREPLEGCPAYIMDSVEGGPKHYCELGTAPHRKHLTRFDVGLDITWLLMTRTDDEATDMKPTTAAGKAYAAAGSTDKLPFLTERPPL